MKLVENVDYYIENGKWVFTEKFLLTRPCCHNGCRHCPYSNKLPSIPVNEDTLSHKFVEDNKAEKKH
jgi:hypothetical protein